MSTGAAKTRKGAAARKKVAKKTSKPLKAGKKR